MRLAAAREKRALSCAQGSLAEVMSCLHGYRDVERRGPGNLGRAGPGGQGWRGHSGVASRWGQSLQDAGVPPAAPEFGRSCGPGWQGRERQPCAAPGSPVLPASSRAKLGSHPASPVRNLERSSAGRAQLPLPGATLLCWDKKDKAQLGFGVKKELPAAQTGAAACGGSCSGVPQCPWGAGSNHPSPEEDGKEHEPPTCFHPREFPIHPPLELLAGRAERRSLEPTPNHPALLLPEQHSSSPQQPLRGQACNPFRSWLQRNFPGFYQNFSPPLTP